MMYVSFRAKHSSVSCAPHHGQLRVSVLIAVYCKLKLLQRGLRDVLVCMCNSESLRISLIVYPFMKIIVVSTRLLSFTWSQALG